MPNYKLLVVFQVEIESDDPNDAAKAFWERSFDPKTHSLGEILQITGDDGFHSRAGSGTFSQWFDED